METNIVTQDMEQHTPQGEIILYQPDETVRLEVRLEDETVWLNRQQLAQLFGRDVKTIGKHVNNALQEELKDLSVIAKFATTASDGKTYQVDYYNLLDVRGAGVSATIYTERIDAGLQRLQQLHNQEHSSQPVRVAAFTRPFHDRFLIVDDELWHCGASFKDLGRKLFAIDKLQLDKNIILNQL